ncbi:MAG: hypothetical protein HC890_14290 [Chloroflexaceae bacterium]|nr:hypothetical protein [Chloroflexaceae bacterium]
MFLEELTPILKQLFHHPGAFLGGFAAGLLRLPLTDDPLKNWLGQQGISLSPTVSDNGSGRSRLSSNDPQRRQVKNCGKS